MEENVYILESECESLFEKMENMDNIISIGSASGIDEEVNYETVSEIEEAVNFIANEEAKLEESVQLPEVQNVLPPTEVKSSLDCCLKQVKDLSAGNTCNDFVGHPQTGRVSLIRLQAVHPSPSQEEATNAKLDSEVTVLHTTTDSNAQSVTQLPVVSPSYSEKTVNNPSTLPKLTTTFDVQYSSTSKDTQESQFLKSSSSLGEISSTREMDHFLTSEGHNMDGYKGSTGDVQFLYPLSDDRENHNEKERKRRTRISDACSSLRKLVPGLNPKTDKATVFEQAAKYLKFLRCKFGDQFDQMYHEKRFERRK